jgi:predicted nucleic acid-binding protein
MKLTLDANLFIARYREGELGHEEALAFFKRCEFLRVQLFVPVLLLGEVAGALSRIRGGARFGEVAITRILAHPGLSLRQIDTDFAEKAARMAARHSLRGADAAYLNLARETKSILVTEDDELLKTKSRVSVITPGAWLTSQR